MHDSCAIGTSAECVRSLQRFRDAGADEIVIYGSNPTDNTQLNNLWRTRPERPWTPEATAGLHPRGRNAPTC